MNINSFWQEFMALSSWEMVLIGLLVLIMSIFVLAIVVWFIAIIYTGISVELDEHFIRPLAKCEREHRQSWKLKDVTPTASWYECPICHRERFGEHLDLGG